MSRLGNIRIPPLGAAMNVAWQTLRQQIPEKGDNQGSSQPSERVRFAQVNQNGPQEHHELSNMTTNQWSPPTEKTHAEDAFNEGYQREKRSSKQSLSSLDMSEDDFVEGKSEVKINEYQAAWNVTNAIQASRVS